MGQKDAFLKVTQHFSVFSDVGSCPEAVSFDFGHDNSVWLLDIEGHLWFTTGVTQLTPEGSGDWWQVRMHSTIATTKDLS